MTDRWHLTFGYRQYKDTKKDVGGRSYACFGGGNCSFSAGMIPSDGWPQTDFETDGLLLPQFPSDALVAGMGSQDRLGNYALDSINDTEESFSASTWRIGLAYALTDTPIL